MNFFKSSFVITIYCFSESLQSKVLEDGCLKAVLAYSVSSDSELQFWASALLLNMAMTSDDVKKEIIMLGGLKPLMELAIGDSDHPQCSAHAAKTLVMLGFLGELLRLVHTNVIIVTAIIIIVESIVKTRSC